MVAFSKAVVLIVFLAVALAACGGSSGNFKQELDAARAALAAIPQPPDALVVPDHMHVGEVPSSAVTRNFADNTVTHGGIQVTSATSDGADGYRVTYMDTAGQEHTFHFLADHRVGDSDYWRSGRGGHRLWARDVGWYDYTNIMAFGVSIVEDGSLGTGGDTVVTPETHFIMGERTPASGIPSQGTVTYQGRFRAHAWPMDNAERDALIEYRSSRASLVADLDVGRMTGRISSVYTEDQDDTQTDLTGHIDIASSWIVGGQFTGTLTGLDPDNPDAPLESSVRGLSGNLFGQFYGPNAEEVGGVVNASHNNMVMSGTVVAAQGRRTGPQ